MREKIGETRWTEKREKGEEGQNVSDCMIQKLLKGAR